ncbi:Fic family protein [Luteimonas salinilitoris]|uniref:Fic family protein n=1 Tax=Luteimonas salinilitoris TaxID=3237697 RepID=UPI00351C7B7E
MLLLRAATRDSSGSIDIGQARRFIGVMFGERQFHLARFLELAKEITPKAMELRNEIVFSGSVVPSSAEIIYPPDDVLPELLRSLEAGFASEDIINLDPLLRSVIVGLYCVHIHPFLDGNGRWSRLMASYSAHQASDIWPAMAGVAFMNSCKEMLAKKIWPEARIQGLRKYLELAVEFERALENELSTTGLIDLFDTFSRALVGGSVEKRKRIHLLGGMLISGVLPMAALRSTLNLSSRAAEGRMRSAASVGAMIHFDGEKLNAEAYSKELDFTIEKAVKIIDESAIGERNGIFNI